MTKKIYNVPSTLSGQSEFGTDCLGLVSDILLILEQIYDSERRVKVGLELRQSWFVNSMLLNAEAWHNLLKKDVNTFTSMDKYLVRKILNSHSKAPIELLFLETATIPIEYILASPRLNYLHTIVTRNSCELTKKVYTSQKEEPLKGDWYHLIIETKNLLDFEMDDQEIEAQSSSQFKAIVKKHVRSAAFKSLLMIKSGHTKGNSIEYKSFNIQPYLESTYLSHDERTTLFNMRAESINGFKGCFSSMYEDTKCVFGCQAEDTFNHWYLCKVINKYTQATDINIDAIYQDIHQQKEAVQKFIIREKIRSDLIQASQGQIRLLDTSTPAASAARGAEER